MFNISKLHFIELVFFHAMHYYLLKHKKYTTQQKEYKHTFQIILLLYLFCIHTLGFASRALNSLTLCFDCTPVNSTSNETSDLKVLTFSLSCVFSCSHLYRVSSVGLVVFFYPFSTLPHHQNRTRRAWPASFHF